MLFVAVKVVVYVGVGGLCPGPVNLLLPSPSHPLALGCSKCLTRIRLGLKVSDQGTALGTATGAWFRCTVSHQGSTSATASPPQTPRLPLPRPSSGHATRQCMGGLCSRRRAATPPAELAECSQPLTPCYIDGVLVSPRSLKPRPRTWETETDEGSKPVHQQE